jgi:signal peptidase I
MNGTVASPSPMWMRVVFGRNPKRTLLRLGCWVFLLLVLFRLVLIPIRVSGFSMLPTYHDGKVTLVNHLAYQWTRPKRGDVVALRLPPRNMILLKRIIGLPGERVLLVHGHALINGKPLEEPYAKIKNLKNAPNDEYTLGPDEYYVMGDNRDITVLGPVPGTWILGKVLF